MSRIRFAVWCLAFVPLVSVAKPVLVAVELPDRAQQASWHRLGVPTYELLGTTAIAEVEELDLRDLARQGFICQVIDQDPWSESYALVEGRSCTGMPPSARELWERGHTRLLKVPSEQRSEVWAACRERRLMNRSTLPEQFWASLLTTRIALRSVPWHPAIQALVDAVSTDSLTAYIQRLVDFRTRQATTESSYAASQWLSERFSEWGYGVEFDSLWVLWPSHFVEGYERSVIASKGAGTGGLLITGGHFDSTVDEPGIGLYYAPGADDNASGVAGTLEAARVFSSFESDHPVQFIGWAAEELPGDGGSDVYAERADSLGIDISAVLNMDMIGWMQGAFPRAELRYYSGPSDWLADLTLECATYVPDLPLELNEGPGGSDWVSFALFGYPAAGLMEYSPGSNPYMHDTTDVPATLTPALYTAITKLNVAVLAVLSVCPEGVDSVSVQDVGAGPALRVSWSPSFEQDIQGYRIRWGLESETCVDSALVLDPASASYTIEGLSAETQYFVTVRAVDPDGFESYVATEVVGIPREVPAAPAGVTATCVPMGIRIDWLPNAEMDLAGYRVYRRINDQASYDTLTTALLTDTTYTDAPLSGLNTYYYMVRGFDTSGNAGAQSVEVSGRPVTLDQGILIVDETQDSAALPDSLQDAFYRCVLEGTTYTEYSFDSADTRPFFGPYSTVMWHADERTQFLASGSVDALGDYLSAGGRLWFMGWLPAFDLSGSGSIYGQNLGPGHFLYDCMKLSRITTSGGTDSIQAVTGLQGYPGMTVDADKVPQASWGGTMRSFESLELAPVAEPILAMDLTNDTSPFQGKICGVRYLGDDFKTVYFGFPLYFMEQEEARRVAINVLNDLGETVGIDQPESPESPLQIVLLTPNSPNPFGSETTIHYWLPSDGVVHMGIYDIGGRLVRTLLDAPRELGQYSMAWDGKDAEGAPMGSGVYVCRLRSASGEAVRRMVIVR